MYAVEMEDSSVVWLSRRYRLHHTVLGASWNRFRGSDSAAWVLCGVAATNPARTTSACAWIALVTLSIVVKGVRHHIPLLRVTLENT